MTPEQLATLAFCATVDCPVEQHDPATDFLVKEGLIAWVETRWMLTDRGQVQLDHYLAIPLAEQVTVWRVPGALERGVSFMEEIRPMMEGEQPRFVSSVPPRGAPAASAGPSLDLPTDPELLRAMADQMLDNGYGQQEVKTRLGLTDEQVVQFFRRR